METNKYINIGRAFSLANVDLSPHSRGIFHDCLDNSYAFPQKK